MTYRILALLLMLLYLAAASSAGQVVIGETQNIHSSVLNEDRTYRVYLPDSYRWAKDRHYPVLYLLDGQTEFVHTASSVDYLAAQGEIPEMIVVAIDSTVRVRDFTQTDWPSHWIGGGGAADFKRFLSTELIPTVDRTYRTDGFRGAGRVATAAAEQGGGNDRMGDVQRFEIVERIECITWHRRVLLQ